MSDKVLSSFEIPPSKTLMTVLSNSGYKVETAVSDIVDNSIAHKAKNVKITFCMNGKNSYVEIFDDGEGMNDNSLVSAMKLGDKAYEFSRDQDDLGRFGVGMKTASASFCHVLKVISKGSDGITNCYVFPFEDKDWKIYKVYVDQSAIPSKTGTKVIWEDLHFSDSQEENERILNGKNNEFVDTCERVSNYISKFFGLIIKSGTVKISLNGNTIDGWSPFDIPQGNVSNTYDEPNFFEVNGQRVAVRSYLLPNKSKMSSRQLKYATCGQSGSLADFEGIYVYRNNRLLVSGGWLGIDGLSTSEKYDYARIGIWFNSSVETDRFFKINFLKNSIDPPDSFLNKIFKIAKDIRKKSSNSYDYTKEKRPYRRRNHDNDLNVWDVTSKGGTSVYSINQDHPLIKQYTEGLDKRKRDALFKLIEKSFPFSSTALFLPKANDFSDEELKSMLLDQFHQKMDIEKLDWFTAKRQILSTFPFCSDRYIEKVESILSDMLNSGELKI